MNFINEFQNNVNTFVEESFSLESSYLEIGKALGYHFNPGRSTKAEVKKFIYEEIKKVLYGSSIKNPEFENIRTHIITEFFIDDKRMNDKCVQYIEIIRDATRKLTAYTSKIDNWKHAIKLVYAHFCLRGYNPLASIDHLYSKEKSIASAYKLMKKKGYKINFDEGVVKISESEHRRIATSIDLRFKRLGFVGFSALLNGIRESNNNSGNRYYFRRISVNQLTPWGYLFKLSVKHLTDSKRKVGQKRILSELIELAINYATLLDVQEYSRYESMFQTHDSILNNIQKMVLNDQIYSISQVNGSHIIKLIEIIYSSVSDEHYNIPWKVSDYIAVSRLIIELFKEGTPAKFSVSDIFSKLNYALSSEVVKNILDDLSHNPHELNSEYLLPFDASKNNLSFKPLVKSKESEYLFLDYNIFNFGFYEVISSAFRNAKMKDSVVGDLLEEFIGESFRSSNIKFLTSPTTKLMINKA